MEKNTTHLLAGWRFKALIITVILSVIGYLLFTLWGGWQEVAEASAKVGILGISFALFLSLVNYYLRFFRWQSFLTNLGHRIPFWPNLRIYISGFALTTTPGKAGEALRSVFLKDYNIPYRQSFGAFLAERISDLMAVLILACCGLWIYPEARPLIFFVALFILFLLFAIQQSSWLKAIENFAKKMLPTRFAHHVEFFIEIMIAFKNCFSLKMLFIGILLGVIAWAAEGYALYFIISYQGYHVNLLTCMFIYGFSLLIGAVTLLPGGLGSTEVTMLQLLMLNNLPPSTAVATTLVIRLATLWFSVILGLFALPKTFKSD